MITISTLFYAFLMVFAILGLITTVMGIAFIFLILRASMPDSYDGEPQQDR